ncbi:MAG: hypothetical protein BWY74_00119 [Firmicutes bacterium ADurb.Bin419]|nr:MAG: hypothetical protein BWY74_00119 [Firmicutes bacterium ADurb.Bin419]
MNEQMNLEIERTINKMRSSMPSPHKRVNYFNLLRIATHEIRPMYFAISISLTILLGFIGTSIALTPMLTSFCTAPVPLLLIFSRYVWRNNKSMRELEQTFRYSFIQMLTARMLILSVFCLLSLLALTTTIYSVISSISFIRAILCGLMPLTIISGMLLLFAGKVRENELIIISFAILILVSFIAFYLNLDVLLSGCSLILLLLVSISGVVLNVYGLTIIRRRGILYAI